MYVCERVYVYNIFVHVCKRFYMWSISVHMCERLSVNVCGIVYV